MFIYQDTNLPPRGSIPSRRLLAIASVAVSLVSLARPIIAQTPAPVEAKVDKTTPVTQEKTDPLSGAELWTLNCTRCHTTRSPGEFTAAQWETIVMHMRVRANLPAAQAREIVKFLQSGAGK